MKPQLPDDFRDFLRFLGDERVEYLLIGGYAVGYYGHPRTTGDMDVWIALHPENAARVAAALHRFGFTHGEAPETLFLEAGNIVRMGLPPMRIEILNQIDGVEFRDCYNRRQTVDWDGLMVPIISLADLLTNKRSTGRAKDLADVEALTDQE